MSAPQQLLFGSMSNFYRNFVGGTTHDIEIDPADATAGITLVTNGSVTQNATIPSAMANWYLPNVAGIGNSHWVRATVTSGTLSSGTAGSWLALSSDRTWTKTQTVVGSASVIFTLELATDAAGANIVATCTVTLTAEVDV